VQVWQTLLAAESAASAAPPYISTDLPALLAEPTIDAVDVALPIPLQAPVVAAALAAGKHVVSEKPIAPTRAEAEAMIDLHRRQPEKVWMVAENWRYEEAFVRAAAILAEGAIGRPRLAHWVQCVPMTPASKYWVTPWRRDGEYPGGLLLDGGVHYVAVLRMLLGEITGVAAMAAQVNPALQPLDTLTATLQFASGVQASYVNTFALGSPFAAPLTIIGETGSLRVERGKLELARSGEIEEIRCAYYNGVQRELEAFITAVQTGAAHRNTPLEALADLAVVEALLASAESRSFREVAQP
jgi:predicted dehydrogenase